MGLLPGALVVGTLEAIDKSAALPTAWIRRSSGSIAACRVTGPRSRPRAGVGALVECVPVRAELTQAKKATDPRINETSPEIAILKV